MAVESRGPCRAGVEGEERIALAAAPMFEDGASLRRRADGIADEAVFRCRDPIADPKIKRRSFSGDPARRLGCCGGENQRRQGPPNLRGFILLPRHD